MVFLIFTILGLSLFSTLVTYGVNYIDFEKVQAIEIETNTIADITSLEIAYQGYETGTGLEPTIANWNTELFPDYGIKPIPPDNLEWKYGIDGTLGPYFCLEAKTQVDTLVLYDAFGTVQTNYYSGKTYVNNACGANTDMTAPTAGVLHNIGITFYQKR